jgi:hypothetical protein
MDPRLKMQYYADNKWERVYIMAAKRAVTDLWETTYKATTLNNQVSENEEDELLLHVFKKRRVEHNDELATYLKEPVIPSKTDVLLWWKVSLHRNHRSGRPGVTSNHIISHYPINWTFSEH